jgi:hypothetical protein
MEFSRMEKLTCDRCNIAAISRCIPSDWELRANLDQEGNCVGPATLLCPACSGREHQ